MANSDSYVFSSITVSVDGDMSYQPISSNMPQVGTVSISMTAKFLINDGQHRRAAIAEAIKINPALKNEHTVNISFHGVDAEGIFLAMKEKYAFSNGSVCSSGSHAPSYVLNAMGLPENRVSEAVRISWNQNTVVDFSPLARYVKSITG